MNKEDRERCLRNEKLTIEEQDAMIAKAFDVIKRSADKWDYLFNDQIYPDNVIPLRKLKP